MIITQTALQALRTGFNTQFQNGLATAAPVSDPMVTTVTSATKVETYGFLGDLPVFRKWLGEKRIRSLAEKAYALTNEDFEATLGIHKTKIEDDNLGLYGPIVSGWGKDAGQLKDRLAFDALRDGHIRPCYDGQNFFDTDHPVDFAGAPTTNMSGAGAVQPWFLVDLSKPLKPILYQNRKAPQFEMVTDPKDSHVFKTGEYLMGGEARGAAGYTLWQLAHRSTAALDAASYVAAYNAMAGLVNDEGEPLEIRPTHIIVGHSNRAAAKTLFQAQNKAGGESNIYFQDVAIIDAPRLA
ncbi:Mu-like prophage major head subunit gpT family protein [Brevundimonas vitis]|uniref:Mu-like prophage major head subunit gpT family protein n=1 Tax=Brevundimonas vitisensis TaxID=2800818 RepID=A0ABX7BSF6_9CAUL|nr:Mu-like prophage major head subunit gpT family protein [Brevundimonas vitisensis]QQQ19678.1 Mu-like prophage major head subunit gpT family protein [Brevundimonas vitisensis]